MIDMFKTHNRSLTSPAEDAAPIVPGPAEETLTYLTRAIYVGVSGDIALRMQSGATITLVDVPAGTFLPLRVEQVLSVGTTADAIVGFW
jgi:hypothetical protein